MDYMEIFLKCIEGDIDTSKASELIRQQADVLLLSGKVKEYEDGLNITQLIEKENVETPEYVTVSVNDEFVERADFEKALKDGDEVEFLYFMGGGR